MKRSLRHGRSVGCRLLLERIDFSAAVGTQSNRVPRNASDTIVSQYTDPTLNKIFAYVGRNKPENMGYMIHKLSDGKTYQATANLGPSRKSNK